MLMKSINGTFNVFFIDVEINLVLYIIKDSIKDNVVSPYIPGQC